MTGLRCLHEHGTRRPGPWNKKARTGAWLDSAGRLGRGTPPVGSSAGEVRPGVMAGVGARVTMGSGGVGLGAANDVPGDIGPKPFNEDSGFVFDADGLHDRHSTHADDPLVNGRNADTQPLSQRRNTANLIGCLSNWIG